MARDAKHVRPAAIVIGAGEVGSAIAVALHRAGCAVVMTDDVDPAWPRRGMAFTNAWYIGNSELDGEAAVFCASQRSIPSVLDRRGAIAATSWSWAGVAAGLDPLAIVDATMRDPHSGALPGGRDPGSALTVAIVAAIAPDPGVDVVIPCPPESDFIGSVVRASRSGRFATNHRIGDRVSSGQIVGGVGALPVAAPCDGVLRGLCARGARVVEGNTIVEVDPRGDPVLCFGLDVRAAAIGREVVSVLRKRELLPLEALADGADAAMVGV